MNFLDFRFIDFDSNGEPGEGFPLRNGHYQHDEPGDHRSMDLGPVYYLTGPKLSRGESALVLSSWFAAGGSSSQGETARIFTVSGGRLRLLQQIDWSTHSQADRATESFNPATNELAIRSDHYMPGDAHCCISAVDIVTFHWDGARFVQTAIRTEPAASGKGDGKNRRFKSFPRNQSHSPFW